MAFKETGYDGQRPLHPALIPPYYVYKGGRDQKTPVIKKRNSFMGTNKNARNYSCCNFVRTRPVC